MKTRTTKVIIAVLALISAICMFVGCAGTKITVTLSDSSITIQTGYSHQLTATVEGTEEVAVWTTSDSAVAIVDDSGKVTAVREGSATITATVKEEVATCEVTVQAFTPVFALSKEATALFVNDTETLTYTVKSHNVDFTSDATVTYASDAESVATVSNEGVITAVGAGSATITATASINGQNLTATVNVTVTKRTIEQHIQLGEVVLSDSNIVVSFEDLGYTSAYTGSATAKAGSYDLTATVGEDGIAIAGEQYNRVYGETEITLELDDKIVTVDAFLITDVIETKEDVLAFANTTDRIVSSAYYGYYKLGANVDMEGVQLENACQDGAYDSANITSIGFTGVFDGQGYSVSNFTIHQFGVFGRVSKEGVIKNVGFLNAGLSCGTSAAGGVISHIFSGTLQDVRISAIAMAGTSTGYGSIAWLINGNEEVCVKNVVVDIENRNARVSNDSNANNYGGTIVGWNKASADKFTNVYVIRDSSNQLDLTFSGVSTYYGTQTDAMTFSGLSEDVWNTSSTVPTMKHALSYTIEHYLGNSETDKYAVFEKYYPSNIAGSTVSTTAKDYGTHVSVVTEKNVLSGTLSAESETKLVAYYGLYTNTNKTTATEYMAIRGDKGQVSPMTFTTTINDNSVARFTTVTKDEKTAYKIDNVKTGWTDLIRFTTLMAGKRNLNTNSLVNSENGLLEYNGFKKLTLEIYADNYNNMYFGGANGSKYGAVFLMKNGESNVLVDQNGKEQEWITFADEYGKVAELENGTWYTVTIDLTEFYNTNGGTLYFDVPANAEYYIANPRITTVA